MQQKTIDSEFAVIIDITENRFFGSDGLTILNTSDIKWWCEKNCIGSFHVYRSVLFERIVNFENKEDLLLFILKKPFTFKCIRIDE